MAGDFNLMDQEQIVLLADKGFGDVPPPPPPCLSNLM